MSRQVDITRELEDSARSIHLPQRLLIVQCIPHARCAVLRVARPRHIHHGLLARRVRAQQRNQAVRANRLVLEQLDQRVGVAKGAGHEVLGRRLVAVAAADPRAHARAERAHDGGDVGAHLDQVRHGDVPEAELVVVLVVDLLVERAHLLEAVVLAAGELAGEDDGAVGAAAELLRLEGPGAGVVEAHADRLARPLCASSRAALELPLQVVGDVLPHTAGVLTTSVAVPSRDVVVRVKRLGLSLALEDGLDLLAVAGKFVGGEGSEVGEELVRAKGVAAGCDFDLLESIFHARVSCRGGEVSGRQGGKECGDLHIVLSEGMNVSKRMSVFLSMALNESDCDELGMNDEKLME